MKLSTFASMKDLRVFIVFFILGIFSLQAVAASETALKMEGWWDTEPMSKSIHPSIPITAFIDGSILSIENTSPDCDITITIIDKNGEIVYEQEVSAVNTANICIPMSEFSIGEYKLELTNLSGNYLRGNFILCP